MLLSAGHLTLYNFWSLFYTTLSLHRGFSHGLQAHILLGENAEKTTKFNHKLSGGTIWDIDGLSAPSTVVAIVSR